MKKKLALNFAAFCFAAFCLLNLASEANAQRRTTTRRPAARPAAASATANALEIRNSAQKVSTQIKNVSKFVYLLGGIAGNVEAIDADIRQRKITRQATIDQNANAKQSVLQSIRNLQAGLAALEVEFRTKPALRNYLSSINGVTEMTGQAEDQAANGQLTEAGRTLLTVIEKLTDTLAALP